MTSAPDRRTAALIVEQALREVFEGEVVSGLREDSPLGAVGMTDADAVCVADAVSAAAEAAGWACVLDDEAMERADSVAALIDEVVRSVELEDVEGGSAG
jgi:hypothetical protein